MKTKQLTQLRKGRNNQGKKVLVPAIGSNINLQVSFENDYLNQYAVNIDGTVHHFSKSMYANELYSQICDIIEGISDRL